VSEHDDTLLARFVYSDEGAFESLLWRYEAEMYCWILRIARNASATEDVLVEPSWWPYRGRARFDPSRSFGAWMRRVATNTALDHLRMGRRHAGGRALGADLPAQVDAGQQRLLALQLQGCGAPLVVGGKALAPVLDCVAIWREP
jgi:RNA polymerase sigma-70 factor (ECF subfamily)